MLWSHPFQCELAIPWVLVASVFGVNIMSIAIYLGSTDQNEMLMGKVLKCIKIGDGRQKLCNRWRWKIATDGWIIATDLVNNDSLLIFTAVYNLKSASEGLDCTSTTLKQPSQFRTKQRIENLHRTFILSQIFRNEKINARWHLTFQCGNCQLIS